MKTKIYIPLLLVMLLVMSGNAQTYMESENNTVSENLATPANLFLLSSQNAPSSQTQSVSSNSVYIDQIGSENTVISTTHSQTSDINLLQRGNGNTMFLDITANEIIQNILQQGNDNDYFNITSNPSGTHAVDLIQNGNNQDFTMYGSNTISERLKINMTGDNRSLIIRNFN